MVLYKESKYSFYIVIIFEILLMCYAIEENSYIAAVGIFLILILYIYLTLNNSDEVLIENGKIIFNYNYVFIRKKSFEIKSIRDIKMHKGTIRMDVDSISFLFNNENIYITIDSRGVAYTVLKDYFDSQGIEFEQD